MTLNYQKGVIYYEDGGGGGDGGDGDDDEEDDVDDVDDVDDDYAIFDDVDGDNDEDYY